VRFIGNHSSGKMGIAIAKRLSQQGASVTLVCGPVSDNYSDNNITRIDVVSAEEMYNACTSVFKKMDAAIMSAAVADYKPSKVSDKKIKKSDGDLESVKLIETKDILKELGKQKSKKQILLGFALETNNELENAKKKLKEKNLDLIVLNSLKEKGAGFAHDSNKITIIKKNNKILKYELKSKDAVAKDIVDELSKLLN
jgi:phosphopantothenoylcysteine decarboxylase/phosphopantothenate--cysteine ligase